MMVPTVGGAADVLNSRVTWGSVNQGGDGRAFQASVSGQEQQLSLGAFPFTKEQIDQLYKFLEYQKSPSCSLAQKGNQKIKIADGSLSAIAESGSIIVSSSLTLHNVLHVPNLSCNLLSVSKLVSDLNCQTNFFPTHCVFQELTSGRMIGNVRKMVDSISLIQNPNQALDDKRKGRA